MFQDLVLGSLRLLRLDLAFVIRLAIGQDLGKTAIPIAMRPPITRPRLRRIVEPDSVTIHPQCRQTVTTPKTRSPTAKMMDDDQKHVVGLSIGSSSK